MTNTKKMEKDWFLNNLFRINPQGDPEAILIYLNEKFISKEVISFTYNKIIDQEFILRKYKEYSDYWDSTSGSRDPKFRKSGDTKLHIDQFMHKKMYEQSFKQIETSRDRYLFGNMTMEYLREKLDMFKTKYGLKDGK